MPPRAVALSRASRASRADDLGDRLLSEEGIELQTVERYESPLAARPRTHFGSTRTVLEFSTARDPWEQEPDPVAQTVSLSCRLSKKPSQSLLASLGVHGSAYWDPRTFTLSGMRSAADVQEAVRREVRKDLPEHEKYNSQVIRYGPDDSNGDISDEELWDIEEAARPDGEGRARPDYAWRPTSHFEECSIPFCTFEATFEATNPENHRV